MSPGSCHPVSRQFDVPRPALGPNVTSSTTCSVIERICVIPLLATPPGVLFVVNLAPVLNVLTLNTTVLPSPMLAAEPLSSVARLNVIVLPSPDTAVMVVSGSMVPVGPATDMPMSDAANVPDAAEIVV